MKYITSKFFIIVAITLLFAAFYGINRKYASEQKNSLDTGSEIQGILGTKDLEVRKKLYISLIERVGPVEAQDQLFKSGLPFDGESHLLNHEVGEYLYKKYGAEGIQYCRDYFLSSCYHGFVIDTIGDGGLQELSKTFDVCVAAGPTVSVQCAHGIGHGFLANAGYVHLSEALKMCDKAATQMSAFPVYNCYDGVFMENIWGVHDGVPSPDRWIKPEDPIYPCNDSRIDEKYKNACWSNQPSLDYQLFKGDIQKVAQVCFEVKNTTYQSTCFDGLARQIHPLTEGSVAKTYMMCGLMPRDTWKNKCVISNAVASYSVGDRTVPFELCEAIEESAQADCYGRLVGIIRAYTTNIMEQKKQCQQIKDKKWQDICMPANPK